MFFILILILIPILEYIIVISYRSLTKVINSNNNNIRLTFFIFKNLILITNFGGL